VREEEPSSSSTIQRITIVSYHQSRGAARLRKRGEKGGKGRRDGGEKCFFLRRWKMGKSLPFIPIKNSYTSIKFTESKGYYRKK